jgi:dolichyl-phosphate beta-glucosyltransferase
LNPKFSISIIIPAYNEEKRITKCLERTREYCIEQQFDFEIIVTEDGSVDDTVKIVQDFHLKDNRIKLISLKNRLGKGGAIRNAALNAGKEYLCYMDVDLAADPSEFERLLEYIDKYDIVIGSRILRGNLPPIRRTLRRSFFSYFYSKCFRILFPLPIFDPQCGFKLFRRQVVSHIFNEIKTSGFAFDSELLVKASVMGLRIKEVPIIWNHNAASKFILLQQIKIMSSDLLSIWYETQKLYLKNKAIYPQMKRSLKARLLFSFLSLNNRSKREIHEGRKISEADFARL